MDRTGTNPRGEEGTAEQPRSSAPCKLRVVMLSRDGAEIAKSLAPVMDTLRAGSAYEAAAAILAAPTAALVLDLRLMPQRHLRLLEIARRMDVEILAVGAVPAGLTSEDLSGVRLMARGDLLKALGSLAKPLKAPEQPEAKETAVAPPEPLSQSLPEDLRQEATARMLDDSAEAKPTADAEIGEEAEASLAHPEVNKPTPPAEPSGLLTAEELAALLGKEP